MRPSPGLLRWAVSLAAGLALAGGLSLASWLILSGGPGREPRAVELVIAAGTADRLEAGAALPPIPASLTFVPGDTLVLRNQDSVQHRIGSYSVPAGGTLRAPMQQEGSQTFQCTFHPQGAMGLVIKAPSGPWPVLWGALIMGVPLGVVLALVWTFAAGLDRGDEG